MQTGKHCRLAKKSKSGLKRTSDTPPKPREGEVLKQADLDKLRRFLLPRYIDEFNFPAVEFHVSPSGNYAAHPDYLAATEKYSRLPPKLSNVTTSIN
jgi:hypothetical protein